MGVGHTRPPEVPPEQDQWRVRICDADGAVLGAGLLLGTRHVLTCAHVLRPDDLGTEDTAPNIEVVIDFVGLRPMRQARARVAAGGWIPPNDADGGDIALLELEAPQPLGSTAPLRRVAVTRGRTVYTCGFPRGLENGLWVDAKLAGNGGPGIEWVQMNPTTPSGPVRAGFSGAPVFDEMTQHAIGMVVGRYADEELGLSYMIPVESILRHLPRAKEWVLGSTGSDPSLVVGDIESQVLDDKLARELVFWLKRHPGTDNTLIIVTGSPDSPRSATVRRVISLADREQRPSSADPLITQAPEGTVPPAGSIHLAIDATGKTPGDVFGRIVARTGIPVAQSTEPSAELLDSPPPMTIAVYAIDDSKQPVALVTDVLEPLAKRGHRLLLAFRQELSPSLSIARSSLKTWMCAGLVPLPVLDLPDPADKVLPNSTFSEPPTLTAGDLVANQYQVVDCLAHGGVGWVYLARDTHLDDNYVVIKRLININDARAVALEVAERRFLTAVDHPNIVRIFNFVTDPGPASGELIGYIVMEYIGGQSLDEIREMAAEHQDPLGGPLLVEHVVAYGIEILAAFEYLHNHGLLYCDMSPSNVIRSANRIKIIDLGAVRGVHDRWSPTVRKRRYQVDDEEIRKRGLTVQSDIYAVGKTLQDLLDVSTDVLKTDTETENGRISFGIESFRRALERATDKDANRRFPSATAMSQQLRGVLREILSLRDRQQRPEPSTVFTVTAALLDAGLGMVPPLDSWTTNRTVERNALDAGLPSAAAGAVGLPAPQVDADDPAANFLATVSATDARQLIDTLSTFQQKSIEIQLCKCRAHLELADFEKAHECLGTAEEFLGEAADYDWRVAWHHGLLALANDKSIDAVIKFAEVYRALPGEDAPKLALGFCYEQMDKPDDTQHYAQHYYEAVWLRDRSQASAAFGLARIYLRRGNRNDAVTILDEVPNVSRHYDAARIAAVRILSGRLDTSTGNGNGLPTVADYKEVVSRLPALYLDGGDKDGAARGRLTAAVREVALDWICKTEGDTQFNGKDVLGHHVSEQGLRELLEKSFRALAGQARNLNDHGALVDLANEVRPWTPR